MFKPDDPTASAANISKDALQATTAVAGPPTPAAFMLNGGQPTALGFNVKMNMNKFNPKTLEAIFASPDKRMFPMGTGKMNAAELSAFISKVEGPMLQWLQNQENMILFTTNPIQCMQKICNDNKIAVPPAVREHLIGTNKLRQQPQRGVPGIKFNSIIATLANQRATPTQK